MVFTLFGRERFYGWVALAAAAMAYFVGGGVLLYSFGAFLPFICEEFNWSRGAVSGAYTVLIIVMGLSGPLAGMLIGKYGARRVIIAGNFLGVLGLLLLAFHSYLWQFYIEYGFLIGLGFGLGGIIASTTVANNWFVRRGPLALSIIAASGGIGGLVMVPVVMAMISRVGWRSTYLILSAVVLLFAVIIPGLLIRNRPEELGQIPDGASISELPKKVSDASIKKPYTTPVDFTAKEAARTKTFWLFVAFSTTVVFALSMLVTHQVAFLVDMGIHTEIAATALGLLPGTSTVGRLGIGFLGLKYRMQRLTILSVVLMTIGMGLIQVTRSLPMVFVYTTIFGIGYGAAGVAILSLLPAYFGRINYAKIVGITMLFSIILGSTGAPIAGVIYDGTGSYRLSFIIAMLTLIVGLVCLILVRYPIHPSLKESQA